MTYNKWFQAALDALNVEFPNEEAENIEYLQNQGFYEDDCTETEFLLSILTGDVRHTYNGYCPDEEDRDLYDPCCPVCQMIQDLHARLVAETLYGDE